jgi:hypothetical protein
MNGCSACSPDDKVCTIQISLRKIEPINREYSAQKLQNDELEVQNTHVWSISQEGVDGLRVLRDLRVSLLRE